jgi:hypothetical protein
VRERIEAKRGGDTMKLSSGYLTILLTWHKVPKVIGMNKEQKLSKWGRIVSSGKPPPSYGNKWTEVYELRLEEAQSDVVKMAHTAPGQMEAPKNKKELVLVAHAMSEEEFNQLGLARSKGGGSRDG